MKKIYFLLMALLCGLIAIQAQEASIILSNNFVENNLEHIYRPGNPADEPYTIKTTKGGLECIEIPTGNMAYFKTNKAVIGSTDNNLIVKITFFDEGTGNFEFQYNSLASNGGNYNYKGQNIAKTGSNTWVTTTIALTDASFREAQNQSGDFRISSNNYIREITITKGTMNPVSEPKVPVTGSAYSEFIGKSVTGYQAWFQTGDANGGWFHWNGGAAPSPGKLSFEVYPDISEYNDADLAQTGFADFGNGQPAKLFNSVNTNVINTHFKWMKDYGIDGAAVQRFINGIGSAINDSPASHLVKIKNAAEANNRIFYICYDISSTGLDATWDDIIMFDWVYNIEQSFELTKSPAYAKVGNRPVVELWGTGFTGNHPGDKAETIALIEFLQDRGCYVIGGVPTWWRTQTGDSKPDFIDAYNKYDMISPWFIGRFSDNGNADNFYNNPMVGDKAYCDARNIAYMPTLFPGFAWSQWNGSAEGTSGNVNEAPRNAGEFMWRQAANIKKLGVKQMYFSMFDEYDEGTAIMKAATDWSVIPTNQFFQTTSIDGYWLSSDFQLRVAGAAIEMLKGTRPQTTNVPVAHSEGPVYYRNSFESRTTPYNYYGDPKTPQGNGTFPLDPCFKNETQLLASGVNGQSSSMVTTQKKSGLYSARITGNATSATGTYYYKFADAQIEVKTNMELRFSKYTVNELGKYTSVSLLFNDGTLLHNLTLTDTDCVGVSPVNARGTIGQWTSHRIVIGQGNLVGKTITGVLLGYEGNTTGSFDAYFDDLLIQDGSAWSGECNPGDIGGNGNDENCVPNIRTVSIRSFHSTTAQDDVLNEKYLSDNNGVLQWVDFANPSTIWHEIPTGTDGDFYLKNVETGRYIYRNNENALNSCDDWSWNSALLSSTNAKNDFYKFRTIAAQWDWATYLVNVADADLNNATDGGAFILSAINTLSNTCNMPNWKNGVVMGKVTAKNTSNAFTAIHYDEVSSSVANPDCVATSIETQESPAIILYSYNRQIFATNSNAELSIYNIMGKEIENRNLIQGIYIVKASYDGKIETFKIMVND
jgi:hypothetical protein